MTITAFPPPPVFVASVQEFKNDSSQGIFGFYHECMGTIVTGLHVLTICSCVTTYDPHDKSFLLKWPGDFMAVAGTETLAAIGERRGVTNFFTHKNCGGIPRLSDLALAKVNRPWEPTPGFGIAPLGIDPDKSYYDYLIKTKHLWDCNVYSWINRGSVEEGWKPYDNKTGLEEKKAFIQVMEECYPFNMRVEGRNVTIDKAAKDDKFCAKMSFGRGCGVDKGAPLICQKTNVNDREMFLAGIGLGGTKCFTGVETLSLYQGFKDSLAFLRLYLALEDSVLPVKRSTGGGNSFTDDDTY